MRRLRTHVGDDGVGHRHQLLFVARLLCHILGHDDLRRCIDRGLTIVGLYKPILRFHDAALRVGEVLLCFCVGLVSDRRRWLTRLLAAFLLPLGFGLGCCLALLLGCGFSLCLQLNFRLPDLLGARLLVGDPLRHLVAALVAMQLIFRRIGHLGCGQPPGDLCFQLGCALFHARIAHRLVLRCVRFDLRDVERDMPKLDQIGLLAKLQNLQEETSECFQMSLAEVGDGAEIRRIERHNGHEIDALAARLGDPARGVDAAAIAVKQQRHHQAGIKRRLAEA